MTQITPELRRRLLLAGYAPYSPAPEDAVDRYLHSGPSAPQRDAPIAFGPDQLMILLDAAIRIADSTFHDPTVQDIVKLTTAGAATEAVKALVSQIRNGLRNETAGRKKRFDDDQIAEAEDGIREIAQDLIKTKTPKSVGD
ncbi:MAG: hypothetical protein VYD57_17875 [Pseudomonadota bacterium]|nr:hypothetical protein [Pseudomonadota bacterium]